ncbi:MAG TPA: nuclear transport factor 2 family protein [Acidimicrobiales bacterium]|jgi:ketosteroid isomerase-like protein
MSDIELVERVYQRFAERDLDALLELSAADCVITQDARLPWGGHHVGHQGVTQFATLLVTSIDSVLTTDALFEADGQVIQIGRIRGSVYANGAAFDVPEVHTWTIGEGKVRSAHFANDTAAMLAALGGGS